MKKKYSSPQLCYDSLKHLAIMEENEAEVELGTSVGNLQLDMGE